jgi:hypothetical protein
LNLIGSGSGQSGVNLVQQSHQQQQPQLQQQQSQQKKEKQRPETWNKIEQQIFFNALRQNGKNFESITQYFNARQKRFKPSDESSSSGATSSQRSKEQIRHFFYRTWHKINKYIKIISNEASDAPTDDNTSSNSDTCVIDISSMNCSLRDIQVKCLIGYNTLMNKSHRKLINLIESSFFDRFHDFSDYLSIFSFNKGWNKKTAAKLVELIKHGWTTVREKGKIARLRMPICKISSKTAASIKLKIYSYHLINLFFFLKFN